jgi:hypothetical protein
MSNIKPVPPFRNRITSLLACACLLLLACAGARAQSTDVDHPTPVTSSRISGRITPRDIGDSRLTRHFYILTGTPGDLVLSVESRNLDGDVDLFQAGTLRPLAKLSMYAGELSTSTSKSIYLRERLTIVLRVEARTPNDDPGSYNISFSGGFEAMAAPAEQPETDTTAEQAAAIASRDKNTRRVSSVGARLPEPEPPVETTKPAQPETSTGNGDATASTGVADNTETTARPATTAATRAQRPPSTRANRRGRRRATLPSKPPETASNSPATTAPEEAPPVVSARPTGLEAGAKLIIETRDGMRIERYMNTVRRVTVEAGQIVVIMKDGKVARHPMADVTRMAIEP